MGSSVLRSDRHRATFYIHYLKRLLLSPLQLAQRGHAIKVILSKAASLHFDRLAISSQIECSEDADEWNSWQEMGDSVIVQVHPVLILCRFTDRGSLIPCIDRQRPHHELR